MKNQAPPHLQGKHSQLPAPPHLQASTSYRQHEFQLPSNKQMETLSDEAWLFRRAKSYQEYMKLLRIPTNRGSLIPYTSWVGLGSSIKKMYNQPLHCFTNIELKRMDRVRLGGEDEFVLLDTIIHPAKAEATIWLLEEVHRSTTSPHYMLHLWQADSNYHAFIDAIYPKLD